MAAPATGGASALDVSAAGGLSEEKREEVDKGTRFVVDSSAMLIKEGTPEDVWGINLNAFFPPPDSFRTRYEGFLADLKSRLGEDADCAWFMKFENLHCTVASPVVFRGCALSDKEEQEKIARAWIAFCSKYLTAEYGFPTKPLELKVGAPSLGAAAAIFRHEDSSGGIASIRSIIHKYAKDDAGLVAAGAFREGVKFAVPGIIHSTFMRFAKEPADPAKFRRCFEEAALKWTSATVPVTELTLVLEDVPFMQVDPATNTLHRSPLC